jgi:hypothetical protein
MHFSISAKIFLDTLKRSDSKRQKLVIIDTREMNTSNQLNDSLVRQTTKGEKQRLKISIWKPRIQRVWPKRYRYYCIYSFRIRICFFADVGHCWFQNDYLETIQAFEYIKQIAINT